MRTAIKRYINFQLQLYTSAGVDNVKDILFLHRLAATLSKCGLEKEELDDFVELMAATLYKCGVYVLEPFSLYPVISCNSI